MCSSDLQSLTTKTPGFLGRKESEFPVGFRTPPLKDETRTPRTLEEFDSLFMTPKTNYEKPSHQKLRSIWLDLPKEIQDKVRVALHKVGYAAVIGADDLKPYLESEAMALTGELGTLRRPDGGVSTEISITVTDSRLNAGKPTNIPTLVKGQKNVKDLLAGKKVTPEQQEIAIKRAAERVVEGQELPAYETIKQAVKAARARSKDKK